MSALMHIIRMHTCKHREYSAENDDADDHFEGRRSMSADASCRSRCDLSYSSLMLLVLDNSR